MNRVPTLAFGLALATLAAGQPGADAQPNSPAPAASNAASTLSAVDYNFVAQANLAPPSRSIPAALLKRKRQPPMSATTHISWW